MERNAFVRGTSRGAVEFGKKGRHVAIWGSISLSQHAQKHGITLLAGVIDANYQREIE